MERAQLIKKHPLYDKNSANWQFFNMAYEGGKTFTDYVLVRNERESWGNYDKRRDEAYYFNYVDSIISLFNFYLTEKEPVRHIGSLADDEQWKMFDKDCDLKGTNFAIFLNETQKYASIYGTIGFLVNKPGHNMVSVKDEIRNAVFPYVVPYVPPNIFDWKHERDPLTHRMVLKYLKLHDGNGIYFIWYPDRWEEWHMKEGSSDDPELKSSGVNPLGEIPFVWMPNIKTLTNDCVGISDVKDIARIIASIVRNVSSGEEIIKYAGFPMFRRPMEADDGEDSEATVVGHTAVQEFNPEYGEAGKPDWMPTEIEEPIGAILAWIDRKVDEVFRIAHLSGVHGQRKSNNEVASGLALRYEFQQLNAVLIKKSNNMTEAELAIVKLWLKWQGKSDMLNDIEITRSKHFSVDDLSIDLENIVFAMKHMASETFAIAAQEQMVKKITPDMSDRGYKQVEAELRAGTKEMLERFHADADRALNKDRPAEQKSGDVQMSHM